jgi:hypothetical protein
MGAVATPTLGDGLEEQTVEEGTDPAMREGEIRGTSSKWQRVAGRLQIFWVFFAVATREGGRDLQGKAQVRSTKSATLRGSGGSAGSHGG